MQNNRNTQDISEHAGIDTEDWEIAFEPYEGQPGPALTLGFNLTVLKSFIAVEPPKLQEAIDSLDWAMEVLFHHTEFHEIAYGLFHRLIKGQMTPEEEELLRSLGLKF